MSFQLNQEQFWQAVQLEEATDGEIGVGYTGIHPDRFSDDPVSFRRMKQLQSFLLKEFQQLLLEWELGAGAEAAIACGQVILLKHFSRRIGKQLPMLLLKFIIKFLSSAHKIRLNFSAMAIAAFLQQSQLRTLLA